MYDQYGNYIPDEFGGQPVMNPSMAAAMNPQMAAAQQAQIQNTAPVLAAQRQRIQPMEMQSMGGAGYSQPSGDQSFGLSSLADALRSGSKDKDSMQKIKDLSIGQRWDNTINGLSKGWDKFTGLFGE